MTASQPKESGDSAALARQAEALFETAQFQSAADLLAPTVARGEAGHDALVAIGWALENLGRDGEARDAYLAALHEDPHSLSALEGLGNSLYRLGDREGAAARFLAVVEICASLADPDANVLELLGWSQFRLGHLDEGVHSFRTALTLEPELISVRFDLGLALLCAGQAERGSAEYEGGLHSIARRLTVMRRGALSVALFDLRQELGERAGLTDMPQAAMIATSLERALGEAERG